MHAGTEGFQPSHETTVRGNATAFIPLREGRMPEPPISDEQIGNRLHCLLGQYKIGSNEYDLRSLPGDEVVQLIANIVANMRVVLHGTNADPQYALYPHYITSVFKRPAIFATTDARVGLLYTVFRKNSPAVTKVRTTVDEENSFAATMYVAGKKKIFEAPPGIGALLRQALHGPCPESTYDDLFADGRLHILADWRFTKQDPWVREGDFFNLSPVPTDHEYNAGASQRIGSTLHIGKHVARTLLRMDGLDDTVDVYNEEAMAARRQWRSEALRIRQQYPEQLTMPFHDNEGCNF